MNVRLEKVSTTPPQRRDAPVEPRPRSTDSDELAGEQPTDSYDGTVASGPVNTSGNVPLTRPGRPEEIMLAALQDLKKDFANGPHRFDSGIRFGRSGIGVRVRQQLLEPHQVAENAFMSQYGTDNDGIRFQEVQGIVDAALGGRVSPGKVRFSFSAKTSAAVVHRFPMRADGVIDGAGETLKGARGTPLTLRALIGQGVPSKVTLRGIGTLAGGFKLKPLGESAGAGPLDFGAAVELGVRHARRGIVEVSAEYLWTRDPEKKLTVADVPMFAGLPPDERERLLRRKGPWLRVEIRGIKTESTRLEANAYAGFSLDDDRGEEAFREATPFLPKGKILDLIADGAGGGIAGATESLLRLSGEISYQHVNESEDDLVVYLPADAIPPHDGLADLLDPRELLLLHERGDALVIRAPQAREATTVAARLVASKVAIASYSSRKSGKKADIELNGVPFATLYGIGSNKRIGGQLFDDREVDINGFLIDYSGRRDYGVRVEYRRDLGATEMSDVNGVLSAISDFQLPLASTPVIDRSRELAPGPVAKVVRFVDGSYGDSTFRFAGVLNRVGLGRVAYLSEEETLRFLARAQIYRDSDIQVPPPWGDVRSDWKAWLYKYDHYDTSRTEVSQEYQQKYGQPIEVAMAAARRADLFRTFQLRIRDEMEKPEPDIASLRKLFEEAVDAIGLEVTRLLAALRGMAGPDGFSVDELSLTGELVNIQVTQSRDRALIYEDQLRGLLGQTR